MDLFEGLDEFDEEVPDIKRYKMGEDELNMGVEDALAGQQDDAIARPGMGSFFR